jgi:[ribosomal protein S5]-alanine N-acetyltransferase
MPLRPQRPFSGEDLLRAGAGGGRTPPPAAEGQTPQVVLVRADRELMDAALAGDAALARVLGHVVAPGWATFRGALRTTRDALLDAEEAPVWGARLFVSGTPPELVGWGGFKSAPADGTVEIGYEIAESRRGRGLATAAARAMLAEALADARVTRVIAHTLPEPNASNHILESLGFALAEAVEQDGRTIWRYELELR